MKPLRTRLLRLIVLRLWPALMLYWAASAGLSVRAVEGDMPDWQFTLFTRALWALFPLMALCLVYGPAIFASRYDRNDWKALGRIALVLVWYFTAMVCLGVWMNGHGRHVGVPPLLTPFQFAPAYWEFLRAAGFR